MNRMAEAAASAVVLAVVQAPAFGNTSMLAVEWHLVPVAAWVIVLAAAVFVGEYVVLQVRLRRHAAANESAERRLVAVATALRNYARDHGQLLPERLEALALPGSDAVAYRRAPRLDEDERLILVHDADPVRKVLEFPVLRDGRGLIFCSGRLHVVSEDVFEKLRVADDALRERLGLEPVSSGARQFDAPAGESRASKEG